MHIAINCIFHLYLICSSTSRQISLPHNGSNLHFSANYCLDISKLCTICKRCIRSATKATEMQWSWVTCTLTFNNWSLVLTETHWPGHCMVWGTTRIQTPPQRARPAQSMLTGLRYYTNTTSPMQLDPYKEWSIIKKKYILMHTHMHVHTYLHSHQWFSRLNPTLLLWLSKCACLGNDLDARWPGWFLQFLSHSYH